MPNVSGLPATVDNSRSDSLAWVSPEQWDVSPFSSGYTPCCCSPACPSLCYTAHAKNRKEKIKAELQILRIYLDRKKTKPCKRAGIRQYIPNRILWGILLSQTTFCLLFMHSATECCTTECSTYSCQHFIIPFSQPSEMPSNSGVILVRIGDFSAWGQNKQKHLSQAELQFTSAMVLSQAGKT